MKELTCIVCPNGCSLHVDQGVTPWSVSGNLCSRGADFACRELTHPMRTVCSTVRTAFPSVPRLPVRTRGEVPLARVMDVMAAINHYTVERKACAGDVLIEDAAGTGVPVIATADLIESGKGEEGNGGTVRSGS